MSIMRFGAFQMEWPMHRLRPVEYAGSGKLFDAARRVKAGNLTVENLKTYKA
ncbi:hypothetical protein GCM10011273_28090 [Asticcacaulis endophyticus]|uniref:Uncharacterized protein n=1 Tax=Asticcacaulis endophyticus TaxID=1395890 RepID=A0A918QCK9_9CAUL|nr:hypothetical protein GCM10011273_28090 [Asticcacaulis endophyticus]